VLLTGAAGGGYFLAGKTLQSQPFSQVPDYWAQAADWLADNPDGGRTLVLPGTAFAEYDWGRPLDGRQDHETRSGRSCPRPRVALPLPSVRGGQRRPTARRAVPARRRSPWA